MGGGGHLQWHRRGAAGAASSPASRPSGTNQAEAAEPAGVRVRVDSATPRPSAGGLAGGEEGPREQIQQKGWRLEAGAPRRGGGWGPWGAGGARPPARGGVTGRSGSGGVAAGWRPAAQGDRRRWPQWPARRPPQHRPAVSTLAVRMDCEFAMIIAYRRCASTAALHCSGSAALSPPAGPRAGPAEW